MFVNDEYELLPDRLRLSGGIRVDHDNWSGTQVQPNVRLAWTPNRETTWWTSLARAARTPSRAELDLSFTLAATPAIPPFPGFPGFPAGYLMRVPAPEGSLLAEKVTTFDLGYRQRVNSQLSVDIAAFVSNYSQIPTFVTQTPYVSNGLGVTPLFGVNNSTARTHGFEVAADWQVSPDWRIQPNYSRLYMRSPTLADPIAAGAQEKTLGRVPRHRASLRSSWNLQGGQKLDLWLKYTSRLASPEVAAYTVLDLRYSFPLGKNSEIAIIGQNLLDKRHPEFVSDYLPIQQTEIGRSLMVKGTWRF
jgi:iron complex outermembrane receptor protein